MILILASWSTAMTDPSPPSSPYNPPTTYIYTHAIASSSFLSTLHRHTNNTLVIHLVSLFHFLFLPKEKLLNRKIFSWNLNFSYLFIYYLFIYLFVYLFNYLFILSILIFIYSSIHPFIHASIDLSFYSLFTQNWHYVIDAVLWEACIHCYGYCIYLLFF